MTSFSWNTDLIRRYDLSGPRYTSYPTAVEFTDDYDAAMMREDIAQSRAAGGPLSLYTHLPFCAHLCYYCACNKVISKQRDKALPYVERLLKEAAMQADLFGADRPVRQLHWGGGTPTFLPDDVMRYLIDGYADIFNLQNDQDRDYSVEIDPREVGDNTMATLADLGFNRISLGVQDLDPKVQKAVNRIQPREMTEAVLDEARALGFRSINLDLIYGLPHQTAHSFAKTLDAVLEMAPDRLSIFSYAHLPERFYPQTRIATDTLPSPAEKLTILRNTIKQLMDAGYVHIGMDHFARPEDSLAVAQREGRLHRNFQGYTTHSECDLVSLGVSAIGQTDGAFFQNHHDLPTWEASIDAGQLAVRRGVRLDHDDHVRRWVIGQLICHFRLDREAFFSRWNLAFDDYFGEELSRLAAMIDDSLLVDDGKTLEVTGIGRLLIRVICQVFDRYRRKATARARFSRVI